MAWLLLTPFLAGLHVIERLTATAVMEVGPVAGTPRTSPAAIRVTAAACALFKARRFGMRRVFAIKLDHGPRTRSLQSCVH